MLALTDQVEAYQKSEEGLNQRVADFEEMEMKNEEAKTQMLEKMKEQTTVLEELQNLKM